MRTNSEIVDLIKETMKQKQITLSELSRLTGIPKSSLSRYFNKTRQFPINKISIFAEVLGYSPEFLLGVDLSNKLSGGNILKAFHLEHMSKQFQTNVNDTLEKVIQKMSSELAFYHIQDEIIASIISRYGIESSENLFDELVQRLNQIKHLHP